MDENTIIRRIEDTVHQVVHEQTDHLGRGRVKRTFTNDLAHKLKLLFETGDIAVDPFYNRHVQATKRLDGKVIELDIANDLNIYYYNMH